MIEAVVMDFRIDGEVGTTSLGTSVLDGFLMMARKFDVENSVARDASQEQVWESVGRGLTIDVRSSRRVEMQSDRVPSLREHRCTVSIILSYTLARRNEPSEIKAIENRKTDLLRSDSMLESRRIISRQLRRSCTHRRSSVEGVNHESVDSGSSGGASVERSGGRDVDDEGVLGRRSEDERFPCSGKSVGEMRT